MTSLLILVIIALIILVMLLLRMLQAASAVSTDTLAKSEARNQRLTDVLVNVMGELQIERRAASASANEATRSSEQLGAQFVEAMIDQMDVVRSFVRQVEESNATVRALRPLLEQLGWLLVESHFTARGFTEAEFDRIMRALAKEPPTNDDPQGG